MEFMKKQAAGFYLSLLVAIIGLVGLIRYTGNCKTAYFSNLGTDTRVLVCFVAAILLEAVFIAGSEILKKRTALDICPVAAAVLFTVGTLLFISARVNGIAAIMTFTNNASTMADLNHTVITIVFCVITMILAMAASFFSVVKEAKD